jgi:hypothetical protein
MLTVPDNHCCSNKQTPLSCCCKVSHLLLLLLLLLLPLLLLQVCELLPSKADDECLDACQKLSLDVVRHCSSPLWPDKPHNLFRCHIAMTTALDILCEQINSSDMCKRTHL